MVSQYSKDKKGWELLLLIIFCLKKKKVWYPKSFSHTHCSVAQGADSQQCDKAQMMCHIHCVRSKWYWDKGGLGPLSSAQTSNFSSNYQVLPTFFTYIENWRPLAVHPEITPHEESTFLPNTDFFQMPKCRHESLGDRNLVFFSKRWDKPLFSLWSFSKKCLLSDLALAVSPAGKEVIQKYQEENLKFLNNQGGF